jgi:LysR family transcriptional regulator, nitrogen assimilation regulatory protein
MLFYYKLLQPICFCYILQKMELKQFEYFLAIVDSGSFSRAAEKLAIAQPALSRCVALLEQEFDSQLLHRHARGVRTTEAGALLYEQARGIVFQAERTKRLIQERGEALSGVVSIGLPTSVAQACAAAVVHAVRSTLPHVQLVVRESLSWHLEEQLINGSLDIALLYDHDPASPLVTQTVSQQALFLVSKTASKKGLDLSDSRAAKGTQTKRNQTVSLAEIAQVGLLIPTRPHAIRRTIDMAFEKLGLNALIVAQIDGTATILELVADGLGCAILTAPTVELAARPERFELRQIRKPSLQTQMSIATSRVRPITRVQQAVFEIVRSTYLRSQGH